MCQALSKYCRHICQLLRAAGIYNDLGSGSNVDLCIITKGMVDYKRNVELLMGKTYSRKNPVRYAPGTARESPSHRKSACLLACLLSPRALLESHCICMHNAACTHYLTLQATSKPLTMCL